MKKKIHPDVFVSAVLIVFSGWAYAQTYSFLNKTSAVYPRLCLTAITILALMILVSGLIKTLKSSKQEMNGAEKALRKKAFVMAASVFAIFIAYLLVFYFVNYFVATALMLTALMIYFGVRSWKILLLVPACYLICAYYIFAVQLHVRL